LFAAIFTYSLYLDGQSLVRVTYEMNGRTSEQMKLNLQKKPASASAVALITAFDQQDEWAQDSAIGTQLPMLGRTSRTVIDYVLNAASRRGSKLLSLQRCRGAVRARSKPTTNDRRQAEARFGSAVGCFRLVTQQRRRHLQLIPVQSPSTYK